MFSLARGLLYYATKENKTAKNGVAYQLSALINQINSENLKKVFSVPSYPGKYESNFDTS